MKKIIAFFIIVLGIIVTVCVIKFDDIMAFYTHKDNKSNTFSVGKLQVTVTEPNYTNNQVVRPNQVIAKNPTYSNTGKVDAYIRAQIYVPISSQIKYVDENENVITPENEIELFSFTLNNGWVEVEDETGEALPFSGIYEDSNGNKYKVHTYKYVEGDGEKVISPNETIDEAVFDNIKVINYLDMDRAVNLKLYATAIGVQADGGNAEEMWTRFKNQNGKGIMGIID